jgi:hypothetical protein
VDYDIHQDGYFHVSLGLETSTHNHPISMIHPANRENDYYYNPIVSTNDDQIIKMLIYLTIVTESPSPLVFSFGPLLLSHSFLWSISVITLVCAFALISNFVLLCHFVIAVAKWFIIVVIAGTNGNGIA